uniref:Uncharacterized protein n=1 Tax=Ditylenchus dipsaci TaxID=166011 RepID=A0A915E217_9BILA
MADLPAKRSPVVVFVTGRTDEKVPEKLFDVTRSNRPVNHVLCHATQGIFIIGNMTYLPRSDKLPFSMYLKSVAKICPPVKAKDYILACIPVVNEQAVPSRSIDGMLQFEEQSLLADCSITSLFVPENPVPFIIEQVSMEVDAPVDNLQEEQNVPNVQNQENQPNQVEEIPQGDQLNPDQQ